MLLGVLFRHRIKTMLDSSSDRLVYLYAINAKKRNTMKQAKLLRQFFFWLVIPMLSLTSMGCETLKSVCGGHCGAPKAPECGDGSTTLFSEFPVDLDALNVVEPLGHVAPPGHTFPSDHIHLIFKQK